MFAIDGDPVPPHTATSNKVAITSAWTLVTFLFRQQATADNNGQVLVAKWPKKTYQLIHEKTYETIKAHLGIVAAREWRRRLFMAVILTHWVLLYATATALLPRTKTNKNKGLQGRMIWFSSILQPPSRLSNSDSPLSLYRLTAHVRCYSSGSGSGQWLVEDLINDYQAEGLIAEPLQLSLIGHISLGFQQDGPALVPIFESGKPLPLKVMIEICGKTLDELDCYIQQEFEQLEEAEGEARTVALTRTQTLLEADAEEMAAWTILNRTGPEEL